MKASEFQKILEKEQRAHRESMRLLSDAINLLDHAASDACALALKDKRDNAMASSTPNYVSSILNVMHKRHAEFRLKFLEARKALS